MSPEGVLSGLKAVEGVGTSQTINAIVGALSPEKDTLDELRSRAASGRVLGSPPPASQPGAPAGVGGDRPRATPPPVIARSREQEAATRQQITDMAHARSGGEILSNQDRIRSMPGKMARTGPVDPRLSESTAALAESAARQEHQAEIDGKAVEMHALVRTGELTQEEADIGLELYQETADAQLQAALDGITGRHLLVPAQQAGTGLADGRNGFPGMPGMFASSPALARFAQAEDPGSSIVLDKGDLETQLYGQMRRRQFGTPDVALAPQELAYFAKRGALADFAREAEGDIRRDLASGAIDAGRAAERMAKLQKTSASAVDKLSVFGTEQPPQAPQVPTPQQPRAFEPPAAGVAPQAPHAIEAPVAATDQDRALGLIEGLGETVQERIGNLEIAAGSARTQEQQDLVLRVAEHMVFPPRSLVERWSGRQREAARDRLRNLFPKQGKGPSDLDIAKAADLRSKTATRGSEDTRKQNKYLRNMRRKPTGKPDWRFYQSTVTASAKGTNETIRSLRTDISSLRARRAKALKVAEKPLPVFDAGEGDAKATKRAQKAKDAGAGLVTEIDALIFKRVAERANKERYLTTIKADQAKWSELRGRNDWAAARRWLVERFGPDAVLKQPAANNLTDEYLNQAGRI
tara:strand:- start:10717 stop:12630 length:1914 start_codon:yes stop_codon:yes gene_type:complete